VAFFGQPAGTYPVHLHSACNGTQKFHLTVLQGLSVGGDGSGSIEVPSSYFGRGMCVIVYTNTALSRVLTTREIEGVLSPGMGEVRKRRTQPHSCRFLSTRQEP